MTNERIRFLQWREKVGLAVKVLRPSETMASLSDMAGRRAERFNKWVGEGRPKLLSQLENAQCVCALGVFGRCVCGFGNRDGKPKPLSLERPAPPDDRLIHEPGLMASIFGRSPQ